MRKRKIRAAAVLIIAESDPSGSAGLQAGLTTLAGLGAYGMAVPTALTVRGRNGVQSVTSLPAHVTAESVSTILQEMPVDAIKIGTMHNAETAMAISRVLRDFKGPIVVDPMTHRIQRERFIDARMRDILLDQFVPRARVLTPNLKSASALCGQDIDDLEMMLAAASALVHMGATCTLVKGGGLSGDAVDVLVDEQSIALLAGVRRISGRTRGGGCAMSTAVAAALAQGLSPREACIDARRRLDNALCADHPVGRGTPSLSHLAMRLQP